MPCVVDHINESEKLSGVEAENDIKTWLKSHTTETNEVNKKIVSVSYMLAMGVCGAVLVALGSTLEDLATSLHTTSTALGSLFIARGAGAVLGAIMSSKIYKWFQGNHVMIACLWGIVIVLMILPDVKSIFLLHFLFLCLGLFTSTTDTGCQIMTRKVHGKDAGPWLGANTVAFGLSGAIVPLVQLLIGRLRFQYYVYSFLVLIVAGWMMIGPNPESSGRIKPPIPTGKKAAAPPAHYRVEVIISLMVFLLIGGKVGCTAYLETYVTDTAVISRTRRAALVCVLWIFITIGRIAGIQDQRFLTNLSLPRHLSFLLVGGAIASLLVVMFPESGVCLWMGIAFYGLFTGPCVGYCYDLNNRYTLPTEASMSIVMFGLNAGASLVPYAISLSWEYFGPHSLFVIMLLTMVIPLPLLWTTSRLSYDPNINPRLKNLYMRVPDDDNII